MCVFEFNVLEVHFNGFSIFSFENAGIFFFLMYDGLKTQGDSRPELITYWLIDVETIV